MRKKPFTKEEQAEIVRLRREYLARGLNTERGNRPECEAAIVAWYGRVDAAAPKFIWLDGPIAAVTLLALIAEGGKKAGETFGPSLDASLRSSLRSSLDASLDPREAQAAAKLMREALSKFYQTALDVNYFNVWTAFYRGGQKVGTVYDGNSLNYLQDIENISRNAMFILPFRDVCIVVDRPTAVVCEPAGPEDVVRLHNPDGAAMAFGDGWKVHCWHGLNIPADLIERRAELTPQKIALLPNAEIRRAAIEIYGVDRYMPEAGGRMIHQDAFGKLWRRDLGPGEEPYCAVEVLNGSLEPDGTRKTYFLAVPAQTTQMPNVKDNGKPIETALDAVAWTYGMTGNAYKELRLRT